MSSNLLAKTFSLAKALLTGKVISEDRLLKRLEICSTCSMMAKNGALMKCNICGCSVKESGLINLARYEESNSYGCHHPDGSKWKDAGV